jgi:hypothetical protein
MMKLVYPELLFALVAIGIPVIIHLFNFRKFKKVYFTNVRFLNEIQQETKSRSRLKHLLVLAARILTILFLVLAFAQPYLPYSSAIPDNSTKVVGIYIDNSFSMEAQNKNGSLLDEAKKKAKEIALSYATTDRFLLLTGDFEARDQHLQSRDEFIERLNEVQSGAQVKTISQVISRQSEIKEYMQNSRKKGPLFILSDFQKSISDFNALKSDTSLQVYFVPLQAQQQNNNYIDSCWFTSPAKQLNHPLELLVRIKINSKSQLVNLPLKLSVNGEQKALGSIETNNLAEQIVHLTFQISKPGWQQAVVSIKDNPITFDDTYFFSFEIQKEVPVLSINSTEIVNPYMQAVFGVDSIFRFRNIKENQLDYSSFPGSGLLVLNELKIISYGMAQEIKNYLNKGGSLMVLPHPESDITSYNSFFQELGINSMRELSRVPTKIEKINKSNALFSAVFEKDFSVNENTDLPLVQQYFAFNSNNKTAEERLLTLQNGEPFLSQYAYGKGKIYVFAAPLNPQFSSFCKHALCVPTVYNMALYSQNEGPLSYNIAKDNALKLQQKTIAEDNIYHLIKKNFDVITEFRPTPSDNLLMLHNQIKEAGQYQCMLSNKVIAGFSFNYDRKESNLACLNPSQIKDQLKENNLTNALVLETSFQDMSPDIKALNQGHRLWKICIILALFFLAAEILLLKFLKNSPAQIKSI